MRNAWISVTMALVFVVTAGVSPAAAQGEDTTRQSEELTPAPQHSPFDLTPEMARMLILPILPSADQLRVPARVHPPQGTTAHGSTMRKVAAGVAMGFAGMFAGAGVGLTLDTLGDCGCHDPGMGGEILGSMIGIPLGVVLGVWLAGG
jgi:F0F1-type ATP synthase membrane subunit c/vacuolar-type H+-ATPase subunit K